MSNITLKYTMSPSDASATDNHQTMSSREIAQLTEKKHRNVCRDIENLNKTYIKMGMLKIEQGYYTHPSTGNQQHREFLLTREQTIDLITGYRAEYRIRINRRWQQLEHLVSADHYQTLLSQNQTLKTELLKANNDYNAIKVMYDGGLENWQIGMAVNLSRHTISKRLSHLRKLGLIDDERGKHTPSEQLVQSVDVTNTQLALEV